MFIQPDKTIDESIIIYEKFVNEVLRPELQLTESRLEKVNQEIAECVQEKHILKNVTDKKLCPKGFKTQVQMGCNFFMEAAVTDTSRAFVQIAPALHVELTLEEIHNYLDLRIKTYEAWSKKFLQKAADIKADIKLIFIYIGQLQQTLKQQ